LDGNPLEKFQLLKENHFYLFLRPHINHHKTSMGPYKPIKGKRTLLNLLGPVWFNFQVK